MSSVVCVSVFMASTLPHEDGPGVVSRAVLGGGSLDVRPALPGGGHVERAPIVQQSAHLRAGARGAHKLTVRVHVPNAGIAHVPQPGGVEHAVDHGSGRGLTVPDKKENGATGTVGARGAVCAGLLGHATERPDVATLVHGYVVGNVFPAVAVDVLSPVALQPGSGLRLGFGADGAAAAGVVQGHAHEGPGPRRGSVGLGAGPSGPGNDAGIGG